MNNVEMYKLMIEALTEQGFLLDANDYRSELSKLALSNLQSRKPALEALSSLFMCDYQGDSSGLKRHMGFYEKDLIGKIRNRNMIDGLDREEAIKSIQHVCNQLYAFEVMKSERAIERAIDDIVESLES